MCASAGTAPEPGDDEFGIRAPAVFNRDHKPSIGAYLGEPANSAALRTAAGGRLKAGESHVKELNVREMQLV